MGRSENTLNLIVEDNGKGFEVEKTIALASQNNSMGLQGMIERVELAGGNIDIISNKGQSTKIKIQLPLS